MGSSHSQNNTTLWTNNAQERNSISPIATLRGDRKPPKLAYPFSCRPYVSECGKHVTDNEGVKGVWFDNVRRLSKAAFLLGVTERNVYPMEMTAPHIKCETRCHRSMIRIWRESYYFARIERSSFVTLDAMGCCSFARFIQMKIVYLLAIITLDHFLSFWVIMFEPPLHTITQEVFNFSLWIGPICRINVAKAVPVLSFSS